MVLARKTAPCCNFVGGIGKSHGDLSFMQDVKLPENLDGVTGAPRTYAFGWLATLSAQAPHNIS